MWLFFEKKSIFCVLAFSPLPGTAVFPLRACPKKGPVCLLMFELPAGGCGVALTAENQRPRAAASSLCFAYPRDPAVLAGKPCAALSLPQPQNIRQGLVPSNPWPKRVNQGQGGHVGSSGSLAETCFFILTFFVLWGFLKWWDHKVNRKDRPLATIPPAFTRLEKSHLKFWMLCYRCSILKFPIIWLKVISSAPHSPISWLKKKKSIGWQP